MNSADSHASDEPADPNTPTPLDVLRWCAAVAPEVWFPSVQAQLAGVPRDSFDEPLLVLRQAGLVRVADWVRGRGQGFALTPAGQEALTEPNRPIAAPADALSPELEAEPATPPSRGLTAYDRGELTREAFLAPRQAVITPVLLFANAGWFIIGLVTAWQMGVSSGDYLQGRNLPVLLRIGAVSGSNLLLGEWWRLLSCGLVHIGVLHLFANLFSLAVIGPVAESLWGRWRFVLLYLIAGLVGSCLAMAINPFAVLAGASGSIWGLLMAVAAGFIRYQQHLPPREAAAWRRQLILVIGVNAVISLMPHISWAAHLGGAISGFIAALFLDWTRPGTGRRLNLIGVAGLLLILLVALGGLSLAMRYTPRWQQIRVLIALQPKAIPAQGDELLQTAREAEVLINSTLSSQHVQEVYTEVTFALIARSSDSRKAAEIAVRQLQADTARVAERLPAANVGLLPQVRVYLVQVDRLAALMLKQLASGRVPTAEEWKAMGDQLAMVKQVWTAITK